MGDNEIVQDPVEECHRWPQYQNTVSHAGRLPTPNIPYLAGIFDGETAAHREGLTLWNATMGESMLALMFL